MLVACAASPSPRLPAYPLHPWARPASGGPIEVGGAIWEPGPLPYAPGITLSTVIRLAGGPTEMANRWIVVTRGSQSFRVPLDPLIDHHVPDPELAPGDIVTVRSFDD